MPSLFNRLRWFLTRLRYGFLARKDSMERLNRSVTVENYLIRASKGQVPLPDKAKCMELALKLGISTRK